MRSWTNQAGVPVVTFSRSRPGLWVARQEMLVMRGERPERRRRWVIPISYSTVGQDSSWDDTRPRLFLDSNQTEVEFEVRDEESLVVFNVQGTGYYRVNYDKEVWGWIAETLRRDRSLIHPLNRAQIICDLAVLTKTGHVSSKVKKSVLRYYSQETEYGPRLAYKECVETKFKRSIHPTYAPY